MKKCHLFKKPHLKPVYSDWWRDEVDKRVVLVPPGASSSQELPERVVLSEQQQLARIVADPSAPEQKWLNACVAAGNKSLVFAAPMPSRIWQAMSSFAGGCAAASTVILTYACSVFLAAGIGGFLVGMDCTWFVRETGPPDTIGVAVAIFGSILFWSSLLLKGDRLKKCLLIGTGMLTGLATYSLADGNLCSIGIAGVTCAALWFLSTMGAMLKETLPVSFSAGKLARTLLAPLLFPFLITSAICCSVAIRIASGVPKDTSPYTPVDLGQFFCFLMFAAATVVVPGIALAVSSRSKSVVGCAALAGFIQAPVLVGMLVSSAIAGTIALVSADPNGVSTLHSWFPNYSFDATIQALGGARVVVTLTTAFLIAIMACGGGAIGAALNKARNK